MTTNTSPNVPPDASQRRAIITLMKNMTFITVSFSALFWGLMGLKQIGKWGWWPEIISVAFSIGALLVSLLLRWYIRRAYKVHALFAVATVACLVPLWHMGIGLVYNVQSPTNWIMIGIAIFTNIGGTFSYYRDLCRRFRLAGPYNQASGRLDNIRGLWNLNTPIASDAPNMDEKWQRLGRLLIPLAPGIGLLISRNLSAELQPLFFAFIAFLLAYGVTQGLAFQLAIVHEIRTLEKELGKHLLLPSQQEISSEAN